MCEGRACRDVEARETQDKTGIRCESKRGSHEEVEARGMRQVTKAGETGWDGMCEGETRCESGGGHMKESRQKA